MEVLSLMVGTLAAVGVGILIGRLIYQPRQVPRIIPHMQDVAPTKAHHIESKLEYLPYAPGPGQFEKDMKHG